MLADIHLLHANMVLFKNGSEYATKDDVDNDNVNNTFNNNMKHIFTDIQLNPKDTKKLNFVLYLKDTETY